MREFRYRFEAMNTPCELSIFSISKPRADGVAQDIVKESKRLQHKYSYYDKNSWLYRVNARLEHHIDRESKSILRRSLEFYRATDGIFDITMATLKDLYSISKSVNDLQSSRAKLLEFVGCEHIKIQRDKIMFDNKFTKIDLGGFVKEHAVDRAATLIRRAKISSALINFGGDIYAVGRRVDARAFRVGIKDPDDRSKHIEYVEIEDEALTTSASYERNYHIEQQTYSHILSKTDSKLKPKSVTVISPTCVQSGVYSTALMIEPKLKCTHRCIIL